MPGETIHRRARTRLKKSGIHRMQSRARRMRQGSETNQFSYSAITAQAPDCTDSADPESSPEADETHHR